MKKLVVIGSGVAGLIAAVEASKTYEVILVTKSNLGESNTHYAQGGIAAVTADNDTIAEHVADADQRHQGQQHVEPHQAVTPALQRREHQEAEEQHEGEMDAAQLVMRYQSA